MENGPFSKVLDELSERLGCSDCPLQIETKRPDKGFYVRRLPLYGIGGSPRECFLTVPEKGGFFLCAAADCVADSVERKKIDILDPRAYVSGKEVPQNALAEFYHMKLHRWLAERWERTTGIRFETIDRLSVTPYEGEAAQGLLAFLPLLNREEKVPLSKLLRVDFQPENRPIFSTSSIKHVRKVFAGARWGALLVLREDNTSDGMRCRGYIDRENVQQFSYYVKIRAPYQWTMYEGCTPLFNVEFDRCGVYRDPLEDVVDKLCQEFKKTREEFGEIRQVLEAVSQQRHGATLLFLDFEDELVKSRMESLVRYLRTISIVPLPLTQCAELLTDLGRIDGAIVVDAGANVVPFIGALLDGEVAVEGDPGRGSRHNSISTLFSSLVTHSWQEERPVPQGAAAIFSEDGGCRVMTVSEVARQMRCGQVPAVAGTT